MTSVNISLPLYHFYQIKEEMRCPEFPTGLIPAG